VENVIDITQQMVTNSLCTGLHQGDNMTEPKKEKTSPPPSWLQRQVDDLNRQLDAEVVERTEESDELIATFIPCKKPAG
jgi:hypothetical protein